jgi:hypothetical protein
MRTGSPNPGPTPRRRGPIATATATALLSLALAACGSSANTSSTQAASALVTTSTSTTSTTTGAPATSGKHAKPHKSSSKPKKHTTAHTTTTTTTSTTAPTTTSSTTTTTTHSTTTTPKTTTAAPAFARPMHATLVGENHDPTTGKKWAYTVTATDAKGRPLSGTIETEFVFGGAVVGREVPFKHQLTDGKITNKVTFPARSIGVAGLSLQVTVQTSIGTMTLDWSVKPVK